MAFVTLDRRSVSPLPSSLRGIKNNPIFQALSKKLTRRSREDLEDEDRRSSSTDSSSSSSGGHSSRRRKTKSNTTSSSGESFESISSHNLPTDAADVANNGNIKNKRYYSSSADSIMKVFENLTVSSRSKSCSNDKDKKKNKKTPPKTILRPPMKYVYVKGWSGLPTQRIPVPRTYASYPGGCRMQCIVGLNR